MMLSNLWPHLSSSPSTVPIYMGVVDDGRMHAHTTSFEEETQSPPHRHPGHAQRAQEVAEGHLAQHVPINALEGLLHKQGRRNEN